MIYLLEDDDSIRKLVIYALQSQGYEAAGFERPSEFWHAVNRKLPELVLLDVMLPEEDGLSVLKKLRGASATNEIPVIMLTAKNTEFDRVTGLDCGADDFVSKPFGMMELLARVRAVLRRTEQGNEEEPSVIRYKEITLDGENYEVLVGTDEVSLTSREFEILKLLLENPGKVFSRESLLDSVWGYEYYGDQKIVNTHIKNIRKKLGVDYIETIRGVGYKIEKENQ